LSLQTLGEKADIETDYEIAIGILMAVISGFLLGEIMQIGFFAAYGMITAIFSLLGLYAALTHF
jgi:hypothetical protein